MGTPEGVSKDKFCLSTPNFCYCRLTVALSFDVLDVVDVLDVARHDDQVVHAYGFGVATWVCWQGIRAAIRRRGGDAVPTLGLMVLAATSGMGLGALNELIEFSATLLMAETNVGGYMNTGWDLVANFVGAAAAATVIGLRGVRFGNGSR